MDEILRIDNLFARRSIRRYTDEPVSHEQIDLLLKAAMAAPSAANLKPWHFVAVTRRAVLDKLADAHIYGKMLFQAPLAICVCGDPGINEDMWVQDCAASTENILLAATGLGLGGVWLGVYPREDRMGPVAEVLGIPDNIIPFSLLSIGHPGEAPPARTQYDETRVHNDVW
jgi:nitroreductase